MFRLLYRPGDGDGEGAGGAGGGGGGGGAGDGEGGAGAGDDAEVTKWKALARKHELAAQKGAAAERELAELKAKDQTELEKATQAATDAAARADAAELRALRFEVAGSKGLTPAQAKRLVGATKEELEADADELLEVIKPGGGAGGEGGEGGEGGAGGEGGGGGGGGEGGPRGGRPREQLRPGVRAPEGSGKLPTPKEVADRVSEMSSM